MGAMAALCIAIVVVTLAYLTFTIAMDLFPWIRRFIQMLLNHAETADENHVARALDWLRDAAPWDDAALAAVVDDDPLALADADLPAYYRRPFHAYDEGNLCWESA